MYISLFIRECLIIVSGLNLKIRVSRFILFLTKTDLKDYINLYVYIILLCPYCITLLFIAQQNSMYIYIAYL